MIGSPDASRLYTGEAGRAYVAARQQDVANPGYGIDAAYFVRHLRATDRLLDFGCGNGGMLPHLARHVRECEGLEVNEHARALAVRTGHRIYDQLAAIPDRRHDVVVSNHVLEHIADVPGMLIGLRRILDTKGRLILKLPIDDFRSRHQLGWSACDRDRHLHTWTPRLIANNLFLAGFQVQDIRVITSAWHPRLFPLVKLHLHRPAFWLLSVVKKRRQLLAVATVE